MPLEAERDAPPRRILPPVYFAAALAAMLALHFLAPGLRWLSGSVRWTGAVPILAGGALVVHPALLFGRRGTTIKPFEESSALVREGPFRFSRNPIYSGMVLVLIGVWVALGTATPLLVVPVFVWLIASRFIREEERMLEERFGSEYLAYKRSVGRWFGRGS